MKDLSLPDYDEFDYMLTERKLPVSASELHGILVGCACGGLAEASRDWLFLIRDFCLDGEEIPDDMYNALIQLYRTAFGQLKDGEMSFRMFLPEDDVELPERAGALTEWTQGFLSAIGMQKINLNDADDEVIDAFQDMVEISKMDTDLEDEDEATQLQFEEISEFVRMSTLLCFDAFGDHADGSDQASSEKPTIH